MSTLLKSLTVRLGESEVTKLQTVVTDLNVDREYYWNKKKPSDAIRHLIHEYVPLSERLTVSAGDVLQKPRGKRKTKIGSQKRKTSRKISGAVRHKR